MVNPSGSTAILYIPREKGGRGLRSIEEEYKVTKKKAAVKLYRNGDPAMAMVREFEESGNVRAQLVSQRGSKVCSGDGPPAVAGVSKSNLYKA